MRRLCRILRVSFLCAWILCLLASTFVWVRSYYYANSASFTSQRGDFLWMETLPGQLFLRWGDMSVHGMTPLRWKTGFSNCFVRLVNPSPLTDFRFFPFPNERYSDVFLIIRHDYSATAEWTLCRALDDMFPKRSPRGGCGFSFLAQTPMTSKRPTTAQLSWLFGKNDYLAVGAPFWFIELLFILPLAIWGVRWWRSRKRFAAGHCQKCGYDLRATPERCPECGQTTD